MASKAKGAVDHYCDVELERAERMKGLPGIDFELVFETVVLRRSEVAKK